MFHSLRLYLYGEAIDRSYRNRAVKKAKNLLRNESDSDPPWSKYFRFRIGAASLKWRYYPNPQYICSMKPKMYTALSSSKPKGETKYSAKIQNSTQPNGLGCSHGRPINDQMMGITKLAMMNRVNKALAVSSF